MAATTFALSCTQEFRTRFPSEKIFKALVSDGQDTIPKAIPRTIKSVEREAGGIRKATYTNGAKLKLKIDSFDAENLTCKFAMIGGEMLEGDFLSISYELKFRASPDGGSIITVKADYPITNAHIHYPVINAERDKLMNMFKTAEEYLVNNPAACA